MQIAKFDKELETQQGPVQSQLKGGDKAQNLSVNPTQL